MRKQIFFVLSSMVVCMTIIGMDQDGQKLSLVSLPKEMIYKTTQLCDLQSIGRFKQVCKQFSQYDTTQLMCSMPADQNCSSFSCLKLAENYNHCSDVLTRFTHDEKVFSHLYDLHKGRDEELREVYDMPHVITLQDRMSAYAGSYINNKSVALTIELEERRQIRQAFKCAIKENKIALVKQISLSHHSKLKDAIDRSYIGNNYDMNALLLDYGDFIGIETQWLFFDACRLCKLDMIKLCLEKIKSDDVGSDLRLAFYEVYSSKTDQTIKQEAIDFLITQAIPFCQYNSSRLKKLLSMASARGDIDIMRILIDNGALINDDLDADEFQQPLHCAVEHNKIEAVKFLIERGVDVNVKIRWRHAYHGPDVKTPLYIACEKGYQDIAQLLIDNGADVNVLCEYYYYRPRVKTPFLAACENGHPAVAQLLIANGADVMAGTDHDGYTPIDIMKQKPLFKELVDTLPFWDRSYRLISNTKTSLLVLGPLVVCYYLYNKIVNR